MNRNQTTPIRGRQLARALGIPRRDIAPTSKTCRKRAYPTYDAALHALIRRRTPYPLRIYECDLCAAHHLTSRPARST